MNSDETSSLSKESLIDKQTSDSITMNKDITIDSTDFSKDQSEETGLSFNCLTQNGENSDSTHISPKEDEPKASEKKESSNSHDTDNHDAPDNGQESSSESTNDALANEMESNGTVANDVLPEVSQPESSNTKQTVNLNKADDKIPFLGGDTGQSVTSDFAQDIMQVNTMIDKIIKSGENVSGKGDKIIKSGENASGKDDKIIKSVENASGKGDKIIKSGEDSCGKDDKIIKSGEDASGKGDKIIKSGENASCKGNEDSPKARETESEIPVENHKETHENKMREGRSELNVEVNNQIEDDGEGALYIDEGQDKQQSEDSDGDVKKKKDILDTDTEEEEEDEDEKAFGVSIKEKKKKLKQAMGNKPVEKIDLEKFKNEWSDEEEGNEETEKTKADVSNATEDTPTKNVAVLKNNNCDEGKEASSEAQPETQRLEEDIELGGSKNVDKEEPAVSMDSKTSKMQTVDMIAAQEAMKTDEALIKSQNINNPNKAREGTAVEDNADLEAEKETQEINTSDNTDDNLEASLLIEEISQDEDSMIKEEAIVVIGGSNGENLADFVIVNENNEEQEIFEEIGEDGSKTYYVKVKQSEAAEAGTELEVEQVEHHDEAEMKYSEPEKKNVQNITSDKVNKKSRKNIHGPNSPKYPLDRDLALKQLDSLEKKQHRPKPPPPALHPIVGKARKKKSDELYDEKSMLVKLNLPTQDPDPELPQSKELLEKLEKTVLLRKAEMLAKKMADMKKLTVSATKYTASDVPSAAAKSSVKPLRMPVESSQKTTLSQENVEQSADVTPSRKSTRIKIENQTLKDYAVEIPSIYNASSTIMIVSKTPVKAGRPPKRRLEAASSEVESAAAAKRFVISYGNKKRPTVVESDEGPNPVIPPLIVENGKEIVDRLLSGEQRKRRPRGQSIGAPEDLIIVEVKKKKLKEVDASLIPGASEIENNEESVETEPQLAATENSTSNGQTEDESGSTETTPLEATIPMPSSPKLNSKRQKAMQRRKGLVANAATKIPANTWNVEASEEGSGEVIRDGPGNEGELSEVQFKLKSAEGAQKRQSKMNREISSLLGDEGAINMLYSVTRRNRSESTESAGDASANSNMKKRRSLQMKTNLVKNAVMNMTSSSEEGIQSPAQGRLRKKPVKSLLARQPQKRRKISADSPRVSLQSESVIVRRHSESSSGEDDIAEEGAPQESPSTPDQNPADPARKLKATIASNISSLSKKAASPKVPASLHSPKMKKLATPVSTPTGGSLDNVGSASEAVTKPQVDESGTNASVIEEVEQELESLFAEEDESVPPVAQESNTNLENEEAKTEETSTPTTVVQAGRVVRKKSKTPVPQTKVVKKKSEPLSKTTVEKAAKKAPSVVSNQVEESMETSEDISTPEEADSSAHSAQVVESGQVGVRARSNSEDVNVISVKICDDLAYITFLGNSRHNYFTVNILNELTATLVYLDSQDACKAILMMGGGFASGVDLPYLLCDTRKKRRSNATSMANALKQFISTLGQLGKPILLGVSGRLMGAAVTILPLFDFVLAEAGTTFTTLYPRLGQIPECAATFTFPLFLGRNATSELLLNCKKLSAQEAKSLNLVTRVCSPETFEQTAESWAKDLSKYSAQSMQTTKLLLRKDLYSQLNETLSTESDFLIEHWTSDEVQKNLKKHLAGLKKSGKSILK